jgi:hypothetical protein
VFEKGPTYFGPSVHARIQGPLSFQKTNAIPGSSDGQKLFKIGFKNEFASVYEKGKPIKPS